MTARQIELEVAAKHGMTRESLHRGGNEPQFVRARSEAMARCRHELGWSYPRIGLLFGKHHTTVWHAVHQCGEDGRVRAERRENLGQALVRCSRVIGEQARQIDFLAGQLERLRAARIGPRSETDGGTNAAEAAEVAMGEIAGPSACATRSITEQTPERRAKAGSA